MTDIERAVLSCLLNDFDTAKPMIVDAGVTNHWFYGLIDREMFSMMMAHDILDPISFASEFTASPIGKNAGYDYLNSIITDKSNWMKLSAYIESFESEYFRRILSEVSREIGMMLSDGDGINEIIDSAQKKIGSLCSSNNEPSKDSAVDEIIAEYEQALKGILAGVPTPQERLNELIGGVHKGQVTLLAGRGGKGKSMLCCQWMDMLGRLGIPAMSFAFEDGAAGQIARIASCRGAYSHYRLKTGSASPSTVRLARRCLAEVRAYDIEFSQRKLTVQEIKNILYREKNRRDIQIAFIDGFKDIKRPPNKYNDVGYEEHISQELSDIAKALNIAIVVVMHITKIDPSDRISMSHIRGSAQIGNDCRLALALQDCVEWGGPFRERYGAVLDEKDEHGNPNIYGLEVIKTNHGVPCIVPLRKQLDLSRFDEIKALGEV